jgi:hypothetical protein
VFAFQANIYAVLVAKILNVKVITRSNSAPSGWSKNFIKNTIYKLIIKLTDDVMVNSFEFKKLFEKKFNIKVKCIYNPFNKDFIKQKLLFDYHFESITLQFVTKREIIFSLFSVNFGCL